MYAAYPQLAQILRVGLPALLLAQFIIWPIIGLTFPHAGIIVAETTILWFIALYIRRHQLVAEDLLLLNATPGVALLLTAPLAFCCSLIVAELDLYVAQFLRRLDWSMPLSFQKNLLEIQLIRDYAEAPLGLAALVLVPALCEELFFRGFVFTGLYAHYGPRWALLGSSVFFAGSHFNPWQFLPLLVFGLFLGALVHWTHSIYPAILAHAINNLASVAGINLRTYWGLEDFGPSQHLPLHLALLALLALLAGLFLLRRQPTIMPLLIGREASEEAPPAHPPNDN